MSEPGSSDSPSTQAPLPPFEVRLNPPDLAPWIAGNTGVPGFTTIAGPNSGPHVVLLAITHGNEFSGAIVLERILRAGLRPARGTLTCGFVNLAAFSRFDPRQPTLSRFVDEDLNRLWDPALLDGPRRSCELDRAREIRPIIDDAEILLDLHSMLWPSDPLLLCGPSEPGRALALAVGVPSLVVADRGHANGPRIIDYPRFTEGRADAAAVLLEAGQHWEISAVETAHAGVAQLLRSLRMATEDVALPPPLRHPPQSFAEVTDTIIAETAGLSFVQPYRGGEIIKHRETLIATDGPTEIRTPYDDCLLVMPSLRPSRGHTAVRLARFAPR
jgi:predicted deacylase